MAGPVWSLVAKIDLVGGTGYHRYKLVDNAINHIGEWWLSGTLETAHWGRAMHDLTNQFVLEGVRGGLPTLALFVAIITIAFRQIGVLWRSAHGRDHEVLAWALGVSLFVHVSNFLGVSYFGQNIMLWYLSLACIGSLVTQPALARYPLPHAQRAPQTPLSGYLVNGKEAACWHR
jgi:hypothetical protein